MIKTTNAWEYIKSKWGPRELNRKRYKAWGILLGVPSGIHYEPHFLLLLEIFGKERISGIDEFYFIEMDEEFNEYFELYSEVFSQEILTLLLKVEAD